MIKITGSFLVLLLISLSCREDVAVKPEKLISRDHMVEILVDIHLADGIFKTKRYSDEKIIQYSESDFYYSVLKKHQIADSVFEKSLIYYSGKPKEFEKIYTRVINKLTQMEEEVKKKLQEPVRLE